MEITPSITISSSFLVVSHSLFLLFIPKTNNVNLNENFEPVLTDSNLYRTRMNCEYLSFPNCHSLCAREKEREREIMQDRRKTMCIPLYPFVFSLV